MFNFCYFFVIVLDLLQWMFCVLNQWFFWSTRAPFFILLWLRRLLTFNFWWFKNQSILFYLNLKLTVSKLNLNWAFNQNRLKDATGLKVTKFLILTRIIKALTYNSVPDKIIDIDRRHIELIDQPRLISRHPSISV